MGRLTEVGALELLVGHMTGLWKNIRKGANSFFGHVVYATGEGICLRFWYDPWSSPISLKELHPELFVCVVVQEALISDMIGVCYFFERVIFKIVCLCCGSRSSHFLSNFICTRW